MSKFLERVTVVDPTGAGGAQTMYKDKKKRKKKVTRWMRPGEKALRQYLKAERRCWTEMIDREGKSRRKKRDRWLFNMPNDAFRSMDKGCKVFGKL